MAFFLLLAALLVVTASINGVASDLPPHVGGCGQPDIQGSVTRVVSGTTAVPHSWPWQILMLWKQRGICGGTLIAPQWVVTAAHCVYEDPNPDIYKVRIGEHDRDKREGTEEDIQVIKVIIHPKYSAWFQNKDIAMFKLARPVRFNKFVSPACLPKADVPVGTKCYITGWGKMNARGKQARILQQGLLPIVSNEVCWEKNHHVLAHPISKNMICAGSGGTKRTSGCNGDSGGPLVCKINGVWELHGQVSHGSPNCLSTETYTVFSRTFYFVDWIKKVMKKE